MKKLPLFYGIELEGGWKADRLDYSPIFDSSVGKNCRCSKRLGECLRHRRYKENLVLGEWTSTPMQIDKVKSFLDKYYPCAVDTTCGFHVHVSFPNLGYYTRITERKFWRYFRFRMRGFIKTLSNNGLKQDASLLKKRMFSSHRYSNLYPSDPFRPDIQLRSGNNERYSPINFCAYRKHNTVEFRVFPMFQSKETAYKAVKEIEHILQTYLKDKKPLQSFKSEIDLDLSEEVIVVN